MQSCAGQVRSRYSTTQRNTEWTKDPLKYDGVNIASIIINFILSSKSTLKH